MSVTIMGHVWDDETITSKAELLLLLALADYADKYGTCFPSIKTLAEKTRCDVRNVQRMMDRLKRRGWVKVELNAGPYGSNLYTITPRQQSHPGKMPPPAMATEDPRRQRPDPPATAPDKPSREPSKNHQEMENVDFDESTPSLEDSESDSPEAPEPTPQAEAASPPRRAPRMPPPRPNAPESFETHRDAGTDEGADPTPKTPPTRQSQLRQSGLSGDKANQVAVAWNKLSAAAGLPGILQLTKPRAKALAQRLRDPVWLENWEAALAQVPKADWRTGKNDRQWRATFDWFVRPDTVAKLIEERDAAAPVTGPAPAPKPKSKFPVGSKEWEKEQMSR